MALKDEMKMATVREYTGIPLGFLLIALLVAGLTFALVGF